MDRPNSPPTTGGIPGLFLLSDPAEETVPMVDVGNVSTLPTVAAGENIEEVAAAGAQESTITEGIKLDSDSIETGAPATAAAAAAAGNSGPAFSREDFKFALGDAQEIMAEPKKGDIPTVVKEEGEEEGEEEEEGEGQGQNAQVQEAQEKPVGLKQEGTEEQDEQMQGIHEDKTVKAEKGDGKPLKEGEVKEDTGPVEAETALQTAAAATAVAIRDTPMEVDDVAAAATTTEEDSTAAFQAAALANKSQPDAEWELDSDDSSSDESSDSDSSSNAGSSDYDLLDPSSLAALLMDEADDASDTEPNAPLKGALKTKNEIPESSLPIPRPPPIMPTTPIRPLGTITTILGPLLLIAADSPGDHQVLAESSLLVLENRTTLGLISDILGRVESPLYTVRFNTPTELLETGVKVGDPVFFVPEHSNFVFTAPLRTVKGSDASNIWDEEVGEADREFSDDEEEAEAKRERKFRNSGAPPARTGEKRRMDGGRAGRRGQVQQSVETDEPYVPLTRPANLHEMLNAPPPPPPASYSRAMPTDSNAQGGRGGRQNATPRGGRHNNNNHRNDRNNDRNHSTHPHTHHNPTYNNSNNRYPTAPPPPAQPQYQPQQYQQQQWTPQSNVGAFPPYQTFSQQGYTQLPQGAHVNPAFFQGGWVPPPPPPLQQQMQYGQGMQGQYGQQGQGQYGGYMGQQQQQQQQGQKQVQMDPEALRALQTLLGLGRGQQQPQGPPQQ